MEIKCFFSGSGENYSCYIHSSPAFILSPVKVKTFVGKHGHGQTNQSVKVLNIDVKPNMHFLPKGIGKMFPNLVRISIELIGLKEITADDFFGLDNLQHMYIYDNQLTKLPSNFFKHTKMLEYFGVSINCMDKIDLSMFDTIPQDQWKRIRVVFKSTVVWYEPGINEEIKTMKEFKNAMRVASGFKALDLAQLEKSSADGFKNLWQQRELSDFLVIAGSKTFPVHKVVIGARSPVICKIIKTDANVKATNKLKINDCSEEVVEEFLQCLYTGKVNEGAERNAFDLFSLAATFEVSDLIAVSEQLVIEDLNDDNAIKALTLGNLHNSVEIIDAAFNKIKKKYPKLEIPDALKNAPDSFQEFIVAAERLQETIEKFSKLK